MNQDQYTTEEDTAELLRVGKLPKPLRLAAMLEKTMQWPLHGKSADCLREMYELLQGCENEMRYAGWDKLEADNVAKNGVYEQVKQYLEKNVAAQPAVPDAFGTREGEHPEYIQGWNDCRQAMMEMKK